MRKIIIIGGGAAGMFAAISAADEHTEVHIYEHNEKLGKKLFITGKGRCNITNGCDDVEELLAHDGHKTPDFCIRHFIHSVIRI